MKREIAVFLASPGDLGPERQRFRETIEAMNAGFGDGANVTFVPLGWEALLSTVGQRSQSVINQEQIDRCDVFILALNRRWGQSAPDSNFSSYTEEEFHRALARTKSDGAPTIFVFFKRVDPESEGDPGPQLAKVMAFRQSLEETREVLYRNFDDSDSFAIEVDVHLRAYVRGELPSIKPTSNMTLLPLNAVSAIKEARQIAQAALEKAQLSQEQHQVEFARAETLALQISEDAAEAALEGKVERARQRFARAIVGTTNLEVLYYAFEFYYRTGDLDSAVEVGERWQAATAPDSANRAAAYCNLGIVHQTRGELDRAVSLYEQSLALQKKLDIKKDMASNYGNLAIIYQMRGELDQAVAMYEKSLAIETKLGVKEGMASSYSNLGILYKSRGELDRAVEMYEQSLALHSELVHKEGMASNYGNLGIVYEMRGELDQAITMHEQSLALQIELDHKEGMANSYGNLGNAQKSHGELDKAVELYNKALMLNTELGSKQGMATQYANMGGVHQLRGELDLARSLWSIALRLYTELCSPWAETVRQWLSELDSRNEDGAGT